MYGGVCHHRGDSDGEDHGVVVGGDGDDDFGSTWACVLPLPWDN